MTIKIDPAHIEKIIDFMNVLIPLTDKEREVLAALRNDGNPNPELYQGQALASSYDRLHAKIPQPLFNKTAGPFRTLVRMIFIPALSNELDTLSATSPKGLIQELQFIFPNEADLTVALIPSTQYRFLAATKVATHYMVEILNAAESSIKNCETREASARQRASAGLDVIKKDASRFATTTFSSFTATQVFGIIQTLSEQSLPVAFAQAHRTFFSVHGDLHTKCPAHASIVSGMFGNDFSSIVKLADSLQQLSEDLGIRDNGTKIIPATLFLSGKLGDLIY